MSNLALTAAALLDYTSASEILVSFPEKWTLVERLGDDETPIYVAAFSPSQERPRHDHFHGLPPEINLELDTYRLCRFFRPWPQPILSVAWNAATGTGQVKDVSDLTLRLYDIGQAQIWEGNSAAVLWECYLHERGRDELGVDWPHVTSLRSVQALREIWQVVERDMGADRIFTHPHEPTFEGGYAGFLGALGYAQSEYPDWWIKTL